ncbi:GapA-binding peptide SR1P [Brevibacillus choshinensis]|uniref:GapA-binding peptide SR1P n=1 Tax=Brevibacillus choshinensis TaxID=54911 RepID=A0ABX7FJF1_BRECH|nr:GapA-binding peptide SR1P [Brevibacillus choshinensis]QRG65817.1 GapA-binding peptide SR1P [Brevibacillus choshinensis]
MGTIVCQTCGTIIEHFECNSVKTLYAVCSCDCQQHEKQERE